MNWNETEKKFIENMNHYEGLDISIVLVQEISDLFYETYLLVHPHCNWNYLCSYATRSESFFEKLILSEHYRDKIIWSSLVYNPNISLSFIEKYVDLNSENAIPLVQNSNTTNLWSYICISKNLTCEFLIKYIDFFDKDCWESICLNTRIPEPFFEWCVESDKYKNNLDWDNISENYGLSEEFYEKYKNYLNWHILCIQSLSEKFFERNLEYIVWEELCENEEISEQFFERHVDKIIWGSMHNNYAISTDFFRKYEPNCKDILKIY